MKKFLIAMAALLAFGVMQAQTSGLGVRAAYELTTDNDDMFKIGSGFTVGAVYNIPIASKVYFEPGLSFFYDVYDIDVPKNLEESLRNTGLRVPLNFGYTFTFTPDIALAIYTGPQLNYSLTMKTYLNGKESADLFDVSDQYNHFDVQWGLGARLILNKNWMVEVGGAMGCTDICKQKNAKFNRDNVNIGVGYFF